MKNQHPPVSQSNRRVAFFGFAYFERQVNGRWRLRIRWGLVAGALLLILSGLYLAGAGAIFFFYKYQRRYEEVSYARVLALPFTMKEFRREMGDFQIRKAKELIKEREWSKAIAHLTSGVNASPANKEGRLMLAEFTLYAFKRPDRTELLLGEGLRFFENDKEYLQTYLHFLLQQQRDRKAIEICDKLLAKNPDDPAVRRVLSSGLATALTFQGDFERAEDVIQKFELEKTVEGTLLQARVQWDRGRKDAAITYLQDRLQDFSNTDVLYASLVRYYRESGNLDKARQYTIMRAVQNPLNVNPRIEMLYTLGPGQEERRNREAISILQQFGQDQAALLALANYATDQGMIELSRRVYERAVENQFDIAPFSLLLIESHITSKDYAGAISYIEELSKEKPSWLENHLSVFESLRAVAYYGQGNKDMANLYLTQFLKAKNARAETLMAISNRFARLGGHEQSRRLLVTAFENNPENQAALTALIRTDLLLGNSANLEKYLNRLMEMRRPPLDLLTDAYRKLGSDRFIFTQDRDRLLNILDARIRAKGTPGAQPAKSS